MKKLLAFVLCAAILAGCTPAPENSGQTQPTVNAAVEMPETVVEIALKGRDISVSGSAEGVFISRDIVYYENKIQYESGNPYGEGEEWEMHSREEAAAHLVVNITAPGAYRVTGKLSAGQIRIDLGDDAYDDPNAVVELILDNADIACTVAPAIVFMNVYECDGNWDKDTATPDVDPSAAGANLILQGENTVSGAYVAKIFKDKKGEKKERFEGERNRLKGRFGDSLLRDPFYNPNLTLDMEDFSESRVLPKYDEV